MNHFYAVLACHNNVLLTKTNAELIFTDEKCPFSTQPSFNSLLFIFILNRL